MATIKQIEANRLNATKSTGPRTTEGKDAVRFNALKHGLFAESTVLDCENAAAFDKLRDSYVLRWQPATPEEETLVTNLIRYTWLLDRFSKVERHIWNFRLELFPDGQREPEEIVAQAHIMVYKEFDFLQRRLNSTHRNYRADLELLIKLQTARKLGRGVSGKVPPAPEPISEPDSVQALEPEIGFDPPNQTQPRNIPLPAAAHPQSPAVPDATGHSGPRESAYTDVPQERSA